MRLFLDQPNVEIRVITL